jgi:hypothetical protein
VADRAADIHLKLAIASPHRRCFELGYSFLEIGATIVSDICCLSRGYGDAKGGAAENKRRKKTLDPVA